MVFAKVLVALLVGLALIGPTSAQEPEPDCSTEDCQSAHEAQCRPVTYKGGQFQLTLNPVLGWWYVDPMSCLDATKEDARQQATRAWNFAEQSLENALGW